MRKYVIITIYYALLAVVASASAWAATAPVEATKPDNYLQHYLTKNLKLSPTELAAFDMTHSLADTIAKLKEGDQFSQKNLERLYMECFSELSADTIARIFRGFMREAYPNVSVTGETGVGKSFLITQLTLLFSYGIAPDYLLERLNLKERNARSEVMHQVAEVFLRRTQIVLVNTTLLGQSEATKGAPTESQEMRMKSTLVGLFNAAEEEFRRADKPGKRTIFIFDEVASIPGYVKEAMKPILDRGGFQINPESRLTRPDPGFHVVMMTTPGELREMIDGDAATERRYLQVEQREPTENETFTVVRRRADENWLLNYPGIFLTDEAIRYLIHMKDFLFWPPKPAPGSVVVSGNDLVAWKTQHPGEVPDEVTLRDAQKFLMGRTGFTDVWFEGPNGEPPFHDLAERVKALVVDHDEVIDKIAHVIATWARMGMAGDVPVFLLGGPTGSGKDTIVAAFNLVLFGHDGRELQFSLGGIKGFGIESIIEGPPLGNHSDKRPGRLIEALDRGRGTGLILFNEAYDAETAELDKLKVFAERGVIRPAGRDSRPRPLRFPMFLLGEFGTKNQKEVKSMTQAEIDELFTQGKPGSDKRIGAISPALLGRAKKTGGVYYISSIPQTRYDQIVEIWLGSFIKNLRSARGIELVVEKSLVDAVSQTAVITEEHTRGMYAIAVDFISGAISWAMDHGLKAPFGKLIVNADTEKKQILLRKPESGQSWEIPYTSLLRSQNCQNMFQK